MPIRKVPQNGTACCHNGCKVHLLTSEAFQLCGVHLSGPLAMLSYPAKALDRRLQIDWVRDPREGPRVLMSLREDFEPMG